MPLRNHFSPEFAERMPWCAFHGMWPGKIVESIMNRLPKGFLAFPNLRFSTGFDIDITTWQDNSFEDGDHWATGDDSGGVATLSATSLKPTLTVPADFIDIDEYQIQIYDDTQSRTLVATIELVSPSNKDRAKHREAFVNKCVNLLKEKVSVTIVDIITSHTANLARMVLEKVGRGSSNSCQSPIYSTTFRTIERTMGLGLDVWDFPLVVGERWPTIPLCLDESRVIPIDLDDSYEATARVWRI
jgi:hypothetical protein